MNLSVTNKTIMTIIFLYATFLLLTILLQVITGTAAGSNPGFHKAMNDISVMLVILSVAYNAYMLWMRGYRLQIYKCDMRYYSCIEDTRVAAKCEVLNSVEWKDGNIFYENIGKDKRGDWIQIVGTNNNFKGKRYYYINKQIK